MVNQTAFTKLETVLVRGGALHVTAKVSSLRLLLSSKLFSGAQARAVLQIWWCHVHILCAGRECGNGPVEAGTEEVPLAVA